MSFYGVNPVLPENSQSSSVNNRQIKNKNASDLLHSLQKMGILDQNANPMHMNCRWQNKDEEIPQEVQISSKPKEKTFNEEEEASRKEPLGHISNSVLITEQSRVGNSALSIGDSNQIQNSSSESSIIELSNNESIKTEFPIEVSPKG